MKQILQIFGLLALMGLTFGTIYFCAHDVLPRQEDQVAALADQVDLTWDVIEDLRADMAELEDRVTSARAEAYRASRALIEQARKKLEEIPKGQGGSMAPSPAPEGKKSSKHGE